MKFLVLTLLVSVNVFAQDAYQTVKRNQQMQNQGQAQKEVNDAALEHSNKQFEAEKNGTNFSNKDKAEFLKKLKKHQKTVK